MRRAPVFVSRIAMADFLHRVAKRGDVDAFRRLFEDFAPRIKAYMIRRGVEPAVAEDLAQETLLTVWRKAGLYSPEKGSASTWIFTIARNLRIDRIRRELPFQQLPEDFDQQESEDAAPDQLALEGQRQVRVKAALASLPAEQHEVVALAFIDGLSHSEIADRLGLPLGTVKSRMRLAYQKVRETLDDIE